MSLVIDAVSTARHRARYERLRAEQRRESADLGSSLRRATLRYGVPALAPFFALLAVALGRSGPQYAVSVALVVTFAMVHVGARPSLVAFDLLRHRSRRGLVLGTALHSLPWLLWSGVCSAAALAISAPGLHLTLGGQSALGAAFLMPFVCAFRGGARRVLDRSGATEFGRYLPLVAFVIAREASVRWLPDLPSLLVGSIAAGLTFGAMGSAGLAAARELGLTLLGLALLVVPASAEAGDLLVAGHGKATTVAMIACGIAVALAVTELVLQVRHVGAVEIVRTNHHEDGDGGRRASQPDVPLRRGRAGAGLAAARWCYLRDEWFPAARPGGKWHERTGVWMSLVFMSAFTFLRGPVLAVAAVLASGAEHGGVLAGAALLAAFWASRAGSVDTMDLDERLWLLGVDYRRQVLHGLQSLLIVGVVPTMAAALSAWLLTDPADVSRHAAVLLIAAAFVLRVGLVGIWPFGETNRLRPAFLLAALAVGAFVDEPIWSGPLLEGAIYTCAGIGSLGLVLRFLRLREPALRDRVREG